MPDSDEQQNIKVKPRKEYFTMLPNLYDDARLSLYEYRLLAHYTRVGNCWETVRTTAERCHMSKSTVHRVRRSLAANGWITLELGDKGTMQIAVVDVFPLTTSIYRGPKEERRDRIRKLHELEKVSDIKGLCPREGQDLSQKEPESVPLDALKKNLFKKEPLKEEKPSRF